MDLEKERISLGLKQTMKIVEEIDHAIQRELGCRSCESGSKAFIELEEAWKHGTFRKSGPSAHSGRPMLSLGDEVDAVVLPVVIEIRKFPWACVRRKRIRGKS